MIALASVEFTQRQGVVVDMERYESKLIDYYNDSLGSLQELKKPLSKSRGWHSEKYCKNSEIFKDILI